MATVTKNFRIKSGLIVEGTTGTINGQNILTETGGNAYILNLVGGATLVKSVDAGTFAVDGAGNLTVKPNTFDSYGSASAAQAAASTDATNKSASAQAAAQAFATSADTTLLGTVTTNIATAKSAAEATASADATSKANAAQAAAEATASSDATAKVSAEAALRVSGDAASVATAAADATAKADAAQAAAATDATTKANAAQAAAEATAAAALSSAISTEVSNRNTAISTAVDSLVDGAPALLNTLNELAAAINDDANYTTTITTALGTKANAADVTSSLATAASNASADATSKANAAQAAAEATAAADATAKVSAEAALRVSGDAASVATAAADATAKADAAKAAAELTAANALNAVTQGTTRFSDVNISNTTSQRATKATLISAGPAVAYSWLKADFPTAKAIVKFETATHTQVSEVLLSSDASNNIAITEYASVGTNGDLGTTSASYGQGYINIDVITVNPDTTVTVMVTLIK